MRKWLKQLTGRAFNTGRATVEVYPENGLVVLHVKHPKFEFRNPMEPEQAYQMGRGIADLATALMTGRG